MKRKIKYKCKRGWPSKIESEFLKRVSAFVRGCKSYKIGITNNPENRFSQPDYRAYNRMIVMYQTQSWKSALEVGGKIGKAADQILQGRQEGP